MTSQITYPEVLNAADYFVDQNLRQGRADKVAVLCEDRQVTYGQIARRVNRFGNALKAAGVRMEERVAMLMLDTEFYPVVFFGSIKTGAVPICLNTLMRPKDYLYFLNDSRARTLVVDEALYDNILEIDGQLKYLERIVMISSGSAPPGTIAYDEFVAGQSDALEPAETGPDDACFWLYSSGSTGMPKGTVHLQHDMVFSAETYGRQVLQVQEDDICFSAAKLFFAYGLGNGLYFPFSVGQQLCTCRKGPRRNLFTEPLPVTAPPSFSECPPCTGPCWPRRTVSTGSSSAYQQARPCPQIFSTAGDRPMAWISWTVSDPRRSPISMCPTAGKTFGRAAPGQIVPGMRPKLWTGSSVRWNRAASAPC